jgi:prepilin-type N-terminal cleavage/methylation domain-containing protein
MTQLRRQGYTILELIVVMVIVLVIGAAVIPTLSSYWRDNKTKATIDIMRARVADARGFAIEQSRNYQVFISEDGTQVMIGPQPTDQLEPPETGSTIMGHTETTTLPKTVTITPIYTGNDETLIAVPGWIKLITFKPDGTCVEDAAEFIIYEPGSIEQIGRVRGLTGTLTVNPLVGGSGTGAMGVAP